MPAQEAALPLHDAGFVMGATVTDLCRTMKHRLFRWDNHLARFRDNCAAARLDLALTDAELTRIAGELAANNSALIDPRGDLALVLFLTGGPIGFYAGLPGGSGDAPPTLGMHTFPLPFIRYRPLFEHGAHLAVATVRQVPASTMDPRIKQRSRLHWWLAEREVRDRFRGASAILIDEDGALTETAAANLLLVKGGRVMSPLRTKVLNGISLRVVQELCGQLAIPFEERKLTVDDALAADEMMLTNTGYCLCGVSRFEDKPVPWPGPVFQRLLSAWSAQAGIDLAGQISRDA
jgi:branched-chain amino acid aminotransferase